MRKFIAIAAMAFCLSATCSFGATHAPPETTKKEIKATHSLSIATAYEAPALISVSPTAIPNTVKPTCTVNVCSDYISAVMRPVLLTDYGDQSKYLPSRTRHDSGKRSYRSKHGISYVYDYGPVIRV